MQLTTRKLLPTDLHSCAEELILAFKEAPWNETWSYASAYTRIEEIMSAPVSRGYVVFDETAQKVVATLCGRIMTYLDAKELCIDEFSVHPAYQGLGLGKQLLDFAKSAIAQENIHCMLLNTQRGYPCVSFYEKNGFKIQDSTIFMVNTFK